MFWNRSDSFDAIRDDYYTEPMNRQNSRWKAIAAVGTLWIFALGVPRLLCAPTINPHRVVSAEIEQSKEFEILQKLWSAYLGTITRTDVKNLLTKECGDVIFNNRVGMESWLKFLKYPEWIEYRPLGQTDERDKSELVARIHFPDGDHRVTFIFLTGSRAGGDQHTIKFHDLFMQPIGVKNGEFWVKENSDFVKKSREAYNSLRDKVKSIAGMTHDYDELSKLLADFREVAERLNVLHHKEVKEFLDQADRLQAFGATWNKTTSTAQEESFKSGFSSAFVSSLKASLSKSGASLDATAEATIKKMVEAEVKSSQKETILKLEDQQAEKFEFLKKDLARAYEALLILLVAN